METFVFTIVLLVSKCTLFDISINGQKQNSNMRLAEFLMLFDSSIWEIVLEKLKLLIIFQNSRSVTFSL